MRLINLTNICRQWNYIELISYNYKKIVKRLEKITFNKIVKDDSI